MAAVTLDGAALARRMREDLQPEVAAFTARAGRPPGLALVLVGDDPASHVYVGSKRTHGAEVGFRVDLHQRPADTSLEEVLALVRDLNAAPDIDGILVQSPLPSAMGADAARRVFETIDPAKDVDGFTAENVGRLVQNREGLVACTPAGIIELLERQGIAIAGKRAVVIGRSDIVGKPMALLLLHRHATVTIAHSRTPDLPAVCREADILVAAIGRAGFVTPDFVKPGAAVIDVGMNAVTSEADVIGFFGADSKRHEAWRKRGSVLMGDVHPAVADVAGALTPVPGGVGPLTIAMLMRNTLTAAERRVR
ncbi:bifunctional protein FolD [Luteitalea sp. TBR-22]|uniref:bifunctional 5,10-methylenetetrahydrofolate dehydrogenase/5,10-methenyltetrahydrofolate cyclohydrolase n=1 Tax=Luteitalea sp. TBR-22 TaxID=2802971 RepID=UPI001AFBDB7B|nr:bifunctional 5,10-methylenetetrahydrofolate dehydrogenase/5,10-methenyltetrahydrofolate cyclohydrolase [Luteitalea sp. TBR-22]BCS33847.1 bifunctional protein FolD [Luteitalea sp. TBR-22]